MQKNGILADTVQVISDNKGLHLLWLGVVHGW